MDHSERLNRLDDIGESREIRMKIEEAIRRLAFIKYLYGVGVAQSKKPEPLCWTSVLTFHDSIELFLALAAEHLDVKKRLGKISFMEYWPLLSQELKSTDKNELSQKISIEKLNKARVDFKHYGIPPSKSVMENYRVDTTNFFEENTPKVFDVEFFLVSLIDLVEYKNTRESLKKAQKSLNEDRKKEALCKVALSFTQLINDYESKKTDQFGRSPFFFGAEFEPVDGTYTENKVLQDAMKILSLGLDYRRYTRFRLLTPLILRIPGGQKVKYKIQWTKALAKIVTAEDIRFCIDFVIESAIILQEFDFEVKPRKTRSLLDLFKT